MASIHSTRDIDSDPRILRILRKIRFSPVLLRFYSGFTPVYSGNRNGIETV